MSNRLVSLGILGALTFSASPVFAQGTDMPEPPTPEEACARLQENEDRYAICIERHTKMQQAHEECKELEGQERRECMREIIGENGSGFHFGFGRFRRHVRHDIKEECQNLERGSEEFRTCAMEHRTEIRNQVKENHPRMFSKIQFGRHLHNFLIDAPEGALDELKACRLNETREEKLQCIHDVTEKYDTETEEENETEESDA